MFRMKFQSTVDYSALSDEEDEKTVREDSPFSCSPEPSPKVVLASQEPIHPTPQHATNTVLDEESLPGNDSMAEKTTYLYSQDSSSGQDSKTMVLAPCEARTGSESTSETSECSTPTDRNEEEEDSVVTEMINLHLQERMNILQKNDDKFAEPWEEPLLAAHDQQELNLMAMEEAKIEVKKLAEEERLERERQLRELRDLAHCVTVNAPSQGRRSPTFTKSKPKRIWGKTVVIWFYRFVKRPFRIFRSHKKYTEYADAGAAKVVIPKASLFGGGRTVPSGITDSSQLAMMRNAPQPRMTRQSHIQFATVESTQRDVPAWTREEYLRKNGRIPQKNSNNKEDEEFGGIEGNNLRNQYFDDGILTDDDSDSD